MTNIMLAIAMLCGSQNVSPANKACQERLTTCVLSAAPNVNPGLALARCVEKVK